MAAARFFHIGILVADIEEAIGRFSQVSGVEFAPPETVSVADLGEPARSGPFELTLSYFKQRPPHVELLEAKGTGVYGTHHGFGLYHIGAWTDDFEARWSELKDQGMEPEAVFSSEEISRQVGVPIVYGSLALRLRDSAGRLRLARAPSKVTAP